MPVENARLFVLRPNGRFLVERVALNALSGFRSGTSVLRTSRSTLDCMVPAWLSAGPGFALMLMPKPINLIVACGENRVIGRAGRLPFEIPEDKAWFHGKTAGQTVVMGRICFATWPGAQTDGRQPIIITDAAPALATAGVRV